MLKKKKKGFLLLERYSQTWKEDARKNTKVLNYNWRNPYELIIKHTYRHAHRAIYF